MHIQETPKESFEDSEVIVNERHEQAVDDDESNDTTETTVQDFDETETEINDSYEELDTSAVHDAKNEDQFTREYQTIKQQLTQPAFQQDKEEIEELKNVVERIGQVAENVEELEKAIGETEKLEELLKKNEEEQGISSGNLPFGSKTATELWSVSHIRLASEQYNIVSLLSINLTKLGKLVSDKISKEDLEYQTLFDICVNQITELEESSFEPKRCVRTQLQKKAWFVLESGNKDTISKAEIRAAINNMKNVLIKHKATIEQYANWRLNPEQHEQPFIKELLNDVDKVIGSLNHRIQEIYAHTPPEQKAIVSNFIEQMTGYYHDQLNCGLSGGRSFNAIKPSLKPIQAALKESRTFETVFEESKKLEAGIEKINVLHWVADDVISKVYEKKGYVSKLKNGKERPFPQAGHKLTAIKNQTPYNEKLFDSLDELFTARELRNNIAHSGLIYDPARMEEACKNYEQAIIEMCNFGKIDLKLLEVKQKNQSITKGEADLWLAKIAHQGKALSFTSGVDAEQLQKDIVRKENNKRRKAAKLQNKKFVPQTYEQILNKVNSHKTPEKYFMSLIGNEFNSIKNLEMKIIESLASPDLQGRKLEIPVENFAKLLSENELRKLAKDKKSMDFFMQKPRVFISKKIKDHFASKLFQKDYKTVFDAYVKARKQDPNVPEEHVTGLIYKAAINFSRPSQDLTDREKQNFNKVIEYVNKGLENAD